MKNIIKKWLGIDSLKNRVDTLEYLLLHQKSKYSGFTVLKRHLQPPFTILPRFAGKEIEQD